MAGQIGSEMLLKVDSGGAGTFVTLGGIQSRSLALNSETVDITNSDSVNKWRELLAGAGIKTASISGDGVFLDDAAIEVARGYFFAGTIVDWQVIIPDFGTIAGAFQISALEFSGDHNAEVKQSISLESAGELTFTAA
ncbi:MAG: phage major tail protein, TP901-1 family [Hyphomicrobiales bacterium]|nr:MAG: phage major tail protein, TP901-1 family [Hyphomicrobiales bacterium]